MFEPQVNRVVESWDELVTFYRSEFVAAQKERGPYWAFRAEPPGDNPLSTSLERAVRRTWGDRLETVDVQGIEHRLLREFRRRAHHYLDDLPPHWDVPGWWSLMRHYRAPMRLLDWSYSFWVATYLALEDYSLQSGAWLWAVNVTACRRAARTLLEERLGPLDRLIIEDDLFRQDGSETRARLFSHFFLPRTGARLMDVEMPGRLAFAYPVTPFLLNERLTVQQGTFLVPGDIMRPFRENLAALYPHQDQPLLGRIDLRLPLAERRRAIEELHRMNMDRATLFGGLEGFASSLTTKIALPWMSEGPET